jgi:hypothetical protein
VGYGVRYVNASTGGATKGNTSVGPLRDSSEMTVLRFDPERRQFVDWQLVEVTTEGEAVVGERQPFPSPVPLPDEVPGDDAGGVLSGIGSSPSPSAPDN